MQVPNWRSRYWWGDAGDISWVWGADGDDEEVIDLAICSDKAHEYGDDGLVLLGFALLFPLRPGGHRLQLSRELIGLFILGMRGRSMNCCRTRNSDAN